MRWRPLAPSERSRERGKHASRYPKRVSSKRHPSHAGPTSWRPVLASSGVLSVALLGDALIYAVLPVHADAFGVSLAWVGILLSANRFIRVLLYGWVAQLTLTIGLRNTCFIASVGAVVSTATYGLGNGELTLLLARVLWGLAYAALLLATLAYAVEQRTGAGARLGWGRTVQRLGPIAALIGGAWLTTSIGPRQAFVVLAVVTALALPLTLLLPRDATPRARAARPPMLERPAPVDLLFFLQGFGVDGVFALTITLILAREHGVGFAVLSGGALLAMRHVCEAVAAPLFGIFADRFGAARMFVAAGIMTAVGFAGVAVGLTVSGALVMLFFRGALASLGPAAIVENLEHREPAVAPLARMQAWRDLGAALGPLLTGYALAVVTAQLMHAVLAILMPIALIAWVRSARASRER